MGGVVAFHYAAKHGIGSEQFHVRHIVTLHSPVNGVDLAILAVNPELPWTWLGSALGAQATYDLKNLTESPKSTYVRVAKRLQDKGVVFKSLYNWTDAFVLSPYAIVDGYSRGFVLARWPWENNLSTKIGHDQIVKSTFPGAENARQAIRNGLETSTTPIDSPPSNSSSPSTTVDTAQFTGIESPADDTPVTPGQTIRKTWRVKNTGNRLWGSGDKLVFTGGEQMGAPNEVAIPVTAPGETIDIGVDIVGPSTPGAHRGNWQLRNSQGTFFGDKLWVQVTVPGANNPPPDAPSSEIICTNCPTTVAPGQAFLPTVRVKINSGQLLATRGDMLRNTNGNLYGAFEHVAVVGTVNPGQSYDFTFYADHPITAPQNDGVYESKWRVWQGGGWVGPELTIRFEVKAAVGQNHPPNVPTLTNPGDWAVYQGNGGITLQAQQNGDPDSDSVTQYYFEIFESAQIPNSGWITGNSWSPSGLGTYGYQWRVKVRDNRGAESGWSEVRHFNINDPNPSIQEFRAEWCHEPWGPSDKICFCAKTTGGGLELKLNSANDGSDRGEWKVIGHGDTNLNCNNDNDRPPNWGQLERESGSYRVRLFARPKGPGGWPAAATADVVVTVPSNQRPGTPQGIAPKEGEFVNAKTVALDWERTYRTNEYHLQISTDPNFVSLLVDTHLPPETSAYTHTFAEEYETIYWQVIAGGPYGSNDSGRRSFHLDLTAPNAAISALPPVTTDTKFNVGWSGADARSGLHWYHVQVRDGNRADSQWTDWLVNTTKTAEIFNGLAGRTYYFRVRAMDNQGNWEAWPLGDGDTFTRVDPAAAPPVSWWNHAWQWKRNLVVLNNDSDSMASHFPVHVHFDNTTSPTAAEIYNASQAPNKGDDVRILFNNQTELNRVIQGFTATAIDIWFSVQAGIGGGQADSTSYQMYFGNPQPATPPTNVNSIFVPEADSNTLGLWHFQEGSGGTVNDSSGHNHLATLSNGGWSDGFLGRAASFNGANTTLSIGNASDFNNGGAITLEAWIYPTRRSWVMAFMKGVDGYGHYRLGLNGDGNVDFSIATSGREYNVVGSTNLEANHWYHIAGVHDGGNNMWVYVDGIQEREKTDAAPMIARDYPLYIGNAPWWNGMAFSGLIQHARISNVARRDFPYAKINVLPTVAAGSPIAPPVAGSPDLVVLGLNTYPNADGTIIVEAVVQNQGNRDTQNGFYNDLYVDHLPTGAGDYTGSVELWVNSPIAAGAVVTLTASLPNLNGQVAAAQSAAPGSETTHTLYMQTDSAGVVPETNKANNVSSVGTEICLATADAFEGNNTVNAASNLGLNQAQSHNFSQAGDQDWLKFNAEAGKTYSLSTSNLGAAADTALYLYSTDGSTLLTANDDINDSLASRIDWVAPANGTYYLLIRHWNPNVFGCGTSYQVLWEAIDTSTPTPTSTPLPPDVTPPTATPTPVPPGETPTSTPSSLTPVPSATPDLSVPGSKIYLPFVSAKSNPTPTPSQLVAYASSKSGNFEIYQMRSDGTGQTNLTNHLAYEWGPNWSVDGMQLAFVSDRDGNLEIYVMNADGSNQRRLTQNTRYDAGPTWSPNGEWIAYKSFENGNYRVYLLKPDGSSQKLLTTNANNDWRMAWSPDGTRLAFSSFRDGNGEIYLINADGTGLIRLTNEPTEDNDVAWSPDGKKLAFVSKRDGNPEIYTMNVDGSNLIRLTNNPASDTIPSWSPDGQKLVFTSHRDGFDTVYTMNADGSAQTRIISSSSDGSFAIWKPK